jgi:hypothetical protein
MSHGKAQVGLVVQKCQQYWDGPLRFTP